MFLQELEIRQGHGASSSRPLAISSVYLSEVQFAVVETTSAKFVDRF